MTMPVPAPEPHQDGTPGDASAMSDGLIPADTPMKDCLELDDLVQAGFTFEQCVRLLMLREHLHEVPEMADRLTGVPLIPFTM
jgi:hypothetical protein